VKHYRKDRQVVWLEPKVTKSFDKGKRVVNFFKSSTIGRNDLGKVQEELYEDELAMLQQECKTRWSSAHIMGNSLMTAQAYPAC
jgi:hypothetical protein